MPLIDFKGWDFVGEFDERFLKDGGTRYQAEVRLKGHPTLNRSLLSSYHGIVKTVMSEPFMALDARVTQRGIFITPECEYGLIHLLGVEYLKSNEKVKIFYRQTSDGFEQGCLDLGDHVLQGVLSEISQIHERRNARRELDQFLLHKLALGLVFFFPLL